MEDFTKTFLKWYRNKDDITKDIILRVLHNIPNARISNKDKKITKVLHV